MCVDLTIFTNSLVLSMGEPSDTNLMHPQSNRTNKPLLASLTLQRNNPMFEYYEDPVFTNDLLTLIYILDNNVARVLFTPQMDPKVIPKIPSTSRYTEVLASFQSFLQFYNNLSEDGTYSEIISYYKLKHAKLSFIALHSKYIKLKDMKVLGDNCSSYYNEALYETLLACNEYISNRDSSDMFLAPLYLSKFLSKNGEIRKSKALKNEARRIAKISNKLRGIEEVDTDLE